MADIKKYLSSEGLQAYDSSIKELIDSKFKIDQTLTQAGAAADACAVGEELENKQIQLNGVVERMYTISEDIPGEIVWDGEVGDRDEIVFAEEDGARVAFVRVSDYTPDSSILTDQGFTLGYYFYGSNEERTLSAEDAKNVVIYDDDICAWIVRAPDGGSMPFVVVKMDDRNISFEGITFYQKGIYFLNARLNASSAFYASKLSSPLMTGEGTMIKEEVIPESVVRKAELDAKQDKITGAASTITNANLSSYRALVSDGSGKVGVSSITDTELAQLSGVDGNVQEQIDQAELIAKLALPGTLKWDGVIGEREHVIIPEDGMTAVCIHMYDDAQLATAIPEGNIEFIYSTMNQGEHEVGTDTLTKFITDDFYVGMNSMICYVPYDSYSLEFLGITFPKRGIYFMGMYDPTLTYCYTWTQATYCPEFPIAIPDYHAADAYFEKVETVVGTTSVGDTLTWDGNIDGREVVIISTDTSSLSLIKMSDSAPTKEELKNSNWNSTLLRNGEELSADGLTTDENNTLLNNMSILTYDWLGHVVFFAHNDNASVAGHSLKKGVYFIYGDQNNRTTSLTIEGYDFLVKEKVKETVLKNKHLPADLRHVGSAFDTISTTTNTIEWDGVVGDRLTVQTTVEDGDSTSVTYVHVSDYTPDAALLTEQGFTVSGSQNGAIFEEQVAAEEATGMINTYGNNSGYEVSDIVIVALEDNFVISSDDKPVTFPKKGVYFFSGNDSIPISVLSLSSPILAAPSLKAQLKEEALPSSMFEAVEKLQPLELTFKQKDYTVIIGELIKTNDADGSLYKIYDSYIEPEVFLNNGFSGSVTTDKGNIYNFTYDTVDAQKLIGAGLNDVGYSIGYTLEEPELRFVIVVPKEGATFEWSNPSPGSVELSEGVYFYNFWGGTDYFNIIGYISAPAMQIKESALPDSIKKPADWNQTDPTQLDYIANRPFYGGWSSVIFDSKKHMGGYIPFIEVEDGIVGFYSTISSLTSMGIDISAIKPNKTYTLAVDDKRYTSTAFEIEEDGITGVCIGNISVMLGDTDLGDPNANFLLAYSDNEDMFLLLMLDDTTIGDHWFAIVEGNEIKDTITEDDEGNSSFIMYQYGDIIYWLQSRSDITPTLEEVKQGFEIVMKSSQDNTEITLTEDSEYVSITNDLSDGLMGIDDFVANGFSVKVRGAAFGYTNVQGASDMSVIIILEDCKGTSKYDDVSWSVQKGLYFNAHMDSPIYPISFKINNSTVFAPSTPIKQLDEKYIPDTIARVADIEKQVQTNYIQGNPKEIDFIKNRPFHDEWDSLMLNSDTESTSGLQSFVKQDGFNGVFCEYFMIWPMYAAMKPETQFKVGNTYTFIVNNKVYSGVATEYFYNGFNRVIIGNSNLLLPGSNIGDTNANFVVHYVDNMAGEDPDNFSMLYIDDITEAGEYPIAVYDAEFRDSLNWNDGEYHTAILDDVVFFDDVFFTADDLIDGFTITIVRNDGTVFTFTEEDATLEEEDGSLRILVNEKKRLALTCYNKGITENSHFEGLHGRCGVVLTNFTDVGNPYGKVTSFKPNNPKVLMPKYPAKKIDKRFLPDDIGGGTNEEEVNAIIAAPKTQFTLIDQVTGENYIVCMRDGNLVTYKAE